MVEWLLQAENTQHGSNLALFLAIKAAFCMLFLELYKKVNLILGS